MKKIIILLSILFFSAGVFAQSPEAVNYQAVARNLSGVPLVNQSVDVRFTIHQGSSTGTVVFQETHATSTNQFGLINLAIGGVNTAAFPLINWGLGTFFLQVEINDGSGFTDMGSTQLLSVPYALYAKESGNGPTGAPGHNSLIQSTVEPAGVNCTNGGYFVQSWLDLDDDGTLSAGETSVDYYICNGVDGVNGTNGADGADGVNGSNGTDGVGVTSTVDNGDGTFTINYSDATSFTTADLTGPAGSDGVDGVNGTVYTAGTGISLLGDSITNLGDADNDPTNEIELPATGVTNDVLTWDGSAWVSQAPAPGADDWGTEVVNVSGTNISGDGTILNPIIVTDNDNDATNELELPMVGNTIGDVLYWDGSNWISQAPTSGADDWGTQAVVSDASLTGDGTSATPLSAVPYTAGTAIDITGNVVTNTAPDQTVLLQSSGATTVSGTYPSFTISSTDSVNDADSDPTNEIELPATAITNQVLTWNGSAWVAQNAGAGADNWGSQTAVTDGTSITGDGTAGSPITLGATIPTNTSDLTNDSGFITNANDADSDPNNEIELPATASTNDVLIWNGSAWVAGTAAADGDGNSTNEIQNLSVSGNNLNISGGTGTTISATAPTTGDMLYYNGTNWVAQAVPADNVNDADFDPTNEIELPATASTNDVLIWNGSAWVAGTAAADGDGNSTNEIQDVSITGNAVGISGGGTGFNLSSNGPTTGDMLFWDGANWTAQPVAGININDADSDPSNEFQTLSFADPNLTLSDGGGTIDLSGLTPTTYWSPSGTDIYSNNTGNVGIGITPVHKLDVSGGINTNTAYHIDGTTFLDNLSSSTLVGNTFNAGLSGNDNTFVGEGAGQNSAAAARNTFVGRYAGNSNLTGSDNTIIGAQAGYNATNAIYNTLMGTYSGSQITSGSNNTAIGQNSGSTIATGSSNTFLGYNADADSPTLTNASAIGANTIVTASNAMVLGNNVNVGIGTSGPSAKLDVVGTGGIGIQVFNSSATATAFYANNSSGGPAGIFWNGNVGFGVNPSEKLHVMNGTIRVDNGTDVMDLSQAAGQSLLKASNQFAIDANGGGTVFQIDDGNADFFVQMRIQDGSEGANKVLTSDASGFATWQTPSAAAGFWDGSAGSVYLTTPGDNVGIGVTPSFKLHAEDNVGRRTAYFSNMTNDVNVAFNEIMGVYGGAHGAGASDKIGGYFESSNGSGVNYGVYGYATGGSKSWAGYFDAGDVFIQNALGINGTPSTSSKLYVVGNGSGSTVNITDPNLSNGSMLYMATNASTGTANNSSHMIFINRTGANTNSTHTAYGVRSSVTNTGTSSINMAGYFSAANGSTNWAGYFANGNMYIKDNVGLGTVSPAAKLNIYDNVATGGSMLLRIDDNSGTDILHFDDNAQLVMGTDAGSLVFSADQGTNSPEIYMFSSGSSNGDRTILAHSPTYPTWGLQYQDATDKFNFISGGTPVLTVDLGGQQVGIGTNTPGTALEVNGAVTYTPTTYAAGSTTFTLNPGNSSYMRITTTLGGATMSGIANGLKAGQFLIIENVGGYLLTFPDGGANYNIAGNALLYTDDTITLIWTGSEWLELSRSDN